jgi:hypothetical protein
MSVDRTQQLIDRYFDAMGAHGDFSSFYIDAVTWLMVDAKTEVRGRSAVYDYVVALHGRMSDVHTRRIVVSDRAAYLEGDCINATQSDASRISYCVAYDVIDDRITAMRCYGTFGAMTGHIVPARR